MTAIEIETAHALSKCSYLPASLDKAAAKKFVSWAVLNPTYQMTPHQVSKMQRMAWKYRAQMPPHLVPPRMP